MVAQIQGYIEPLSSLKKFDLGILIDELEEIQQKICNSTSLKVPNKVSEPLESREPQEQPGVEPPKQPGLTKQPVVKRRLRALLENLPKLDDGDVNVTQSNLVSDTNKLMNTIQDDISKIIRCSRDNISNPELMSDVQKSAEKLIEYLNTENIQKALKYQENQLLSKMQAFFSQIKQSITSESESTTKLQLQTIYTSMHSSMLKVLKDLKSSELKEQSGVEPLKQPNKILDVMSCATEGFNREISSFIGINLSKNEL